MTSQEIIEKIDDELILRRATPADTEAIAQFNGHIHAEKDQKFLPGIAVWVTELMNGKHPTCKAEDFILVENTRTKEVISSMCLIDQTWSYEGIEFKVGRPELVGTNEAYRRRGLVRKEFETIHQWSAERGQVLQFITGIPWFYRQFGYEMALEYEGNRKGSIFQVPELEKDKEERYLFRKAEEKDLPFITELYNKNSRRSMVSCVRDESSWHYETLVRSRKANAPGISRSLKRPKVNAWGIFSYPPNYTEEIFPYPALKSAKARPGLMPPMPYCAE